MADMEGFEEGDVMEIVGDMEGCGRWSVRLWGRGREVVEVHEVAEVVEALA